MIHDTIKDLVEKGTDETPNLSQLRDDHEDSIRIQLHQNVCLDPVYILPGLRYRLHPTENGTVR